MSAQHLEGPLGWRPWGILAGIITIIFIAIAGGMLAVTEVAEDGRARVEAEAHRAAVELCETRNEDRVAFVTTLREVGVDEAVIQVYRNNNPELECSTLGEEP